MSHICMCVWLLVAFIYGVDLIISDFVAQCSSLIMHMYYYTQIDYTYV